jgi:hypothetical protein
VTHVRASMDTRTDREAKELAGITRHASAYVKSRQRAANTLAARFVSGLCNGASTNNRTISIRQSFEIQARMTGREFTSWFPALFSYVHDRT